MSSTRLHAAVRAAARDRLSLLSRLGWVGPGLLTALICLTVLASAVPAATALAVGALISGLAHADAVAGLLAMYALALLTGHAVRAAQGPLYYLAEARVDGRHRAELARLASTSPTIDALERAEVQTLIRSARADPESFMDGTPGAGVLAQLDLIGRSLALVGAALVLAATAWWAVPLLVAAAAAVHQLGWHEGRRWRRVWRPALRPVMRAQVWSDAIVSQGAGKEIRIFGLGDWALDRVDGHLREAFDPHWPVGRRILADKWLQLVAVLVPLGVVLVAVALDAARGGAPVAMATAALVAATTVFEAFNDAPRATINAVTCVRAFEDVRARLAGPATRVPAQRAGAGEVPDKPPLVRFEGCGSPMTACRRPYSMNQILRCGRVSCSRSWGPTAPASRR
ncbi:hypothetical protein ACFQX7_07010 [Luedemannella flava]